MRSRRNFFFLLMCVIFIQNMASNISRLHSCSRPLKVELRKIKQISSAKMRELQEAAFGMSSIYRRKRRGPNMEPRVANIERFQRGSVILYCYKLTARSKIAFEQLCADPRTVFPNNRVLEVVFYERLWRKLF